MNSAPRSRQAGVVMLLTMITLAILMIASVAMVRSFQTSLSIAGNIAFKRDLTNQAERGIARAMSLVNSGVLGGDDIANSNYSASMLASDPNNLPLVLLNDAIFLGKFSGGDIADTSSDITVRFVIDRLCRTSGTVNIMRDCSFINLGTDLDPSYQVVYRISVRAIGPRGAQVFLTSTVSR